MWTAQSGPLPRDIPVHQFLWTQYRQGNRLQQFVGKDGFLLLAFRNRADYEDEFPMLASAVERTLLIAEKTLRNLDALQTR